MNTKFFTCILVFVLLGDFFTCTPNKGDGSSNKEEKEDNLVISNNTATLDSIRGIPLLSELNFLRTDSIAVEYSKGKGKAYLLVFDNDIGKEVLSISDPIINLIVLFSGEKLHGFFVLGSVYEDDINLLREISVQQLALFEHYLSSVGGTIFGFVDFELRKVFFSEKVDELESIDFYSFNSSTFTYEVKLENGSFSNRKFEKILDFEELFILEGKEE